MSVHVVLSSDRDGHDYTAAELTALSAFHKKVDSIDLEGALEVFNILDEDGDGSITHDELLSRLRTERVVAFIKASKHQTLKALLDADDAKLEKVVRALDADRSETVERGEWQDFVVAMARERVRYLKVRGLCQRRCYWGKGVGEGAARTGLGGLYDTLLCCGGVPAGFAEDLAYYTANNHPLLALFCRDSDHPYSRKEQLVTLFVLNAWALMLSILMAANEYDPKTQVIMSFVAITIPTLALDNLLFYLLACPCVRFERRGRSSEGCFACCEYVFTAVGHLLTVPLFFLASCFLASSIIMLEKRTTGLDDDARVDSGKVVEGFLVGILGSYSLWPFKTLVKEFSLVGCLGCGTCCGCASLFGVGQWARERDKALAAAKANDDDDGGMELGTAPLAQVVEEMPQADDAPPQAQVVEEMPPAPECAQPPPGYVVPPSPPPGYAQPPPGYAVPPQQATGRQVVTFQVPPGAPPGALCTFALADGRQVQVQIPPGAAPGMTFPCEV